MQIIVTCFYTNKPTFGIKRDIEEHPCLHKTQNIISSRHENYLTVTKLSTVIQLFIKVEKVLFLVLTLRA